MTSPHETEPLWNWMTNLPTLEAASHQPKKTSTHGLRRHGQISIGFRLYGNQTWPKRGFFQAAVVSILLYGCTTWTLTKWQEKKLDGNYTRMLRAILNKSWRQHPTRHQLYGHLPPITKTIQVRRTRHAGYSWRRAHKWCTPMDLHTWPSKSRTTSSNIHRAAMWGYGNSLEDLPEAMNDRAEWRERVKDISASGMTGWWGWRLS